MKLKAVLELSNEGRSTAFGPALRWSSSEGETREEAHSNIQEAIELFLEPAEDDLDFA